MKFHHAEAEDLDNTIIRPGVMEVDGQYIAVIVLGTYDNLEDAKTEAEHWWDLIDEAGE
jgi:hypothetical protein